MSSLSEFNTNISNPAKLLETLKKLTKESEITEHRNNMDTDVFLDLSLILKKCIEDVQNPEGVFPILAECFRFLRNAVIGSKQRQSFIREKTEIVSNCITFLKQRVKDFEESCPNEDMLVATRCCLQFISNFMVDNEDNSKLISTIANDSICSLIKHVQDEKVIEYAAMNIHTLLKLQPDWIMEMDYEIFPILVDNTHLEFIIYAIETISENEGFMTQKLNSLETELRVKFFKVLIAHSDYHGRFPEPTISILAAEFKTKSDLILKSKLDNDQWTCWEIATLLELLCCLTASQRSLQMEASLITTTIFLLKSVHSAGKEHLGASDSVPLGHDFSPVEDLDALRINSDTEDMRSQPTYQFKAHLIRLIANLVHQNFANQELVRETEALSIILDCCRIDARNPFITQWAVFAIRNLCEGNSANQKFIQTMQQIDSKNTLSKLHLVGL